jgi:hypothetical protein
MKRPFSRRSKPKPKAAPADQPSPAAGGASGLPLPSTDPATNFLIADIVLRAAGDFARERIEKKTLAHTYSRAAAEDIVGGQSLAKTIALYGISRIATRSPAGLALVAGGLILKALYDRGKNREARGGKAFPRLKLPGGPQKK